MLSSIIVGAIFLAILTWAFYKSRKSMKNNSCPGCGGGCSSAEKAACHK
jgi:hypothetical protein